MKTKKKASLKTKITNKLDIYRLSDKEFLERKFKKKMGRVLDIDKAQTFSEKLQWLKLYYHKPIMTLMADKYGVRDLIRLTIGEKYLIPLWDVYTDLNNISLENLPDSFILKAVHGSGWNIICYDKNDFNLEEFRKRFKNFMKYNYFRDSKEWVYKNITPRIVCERLILDKDGFPPKDYKIFCFNGEPTYIQVDSNKYRSQMRNIYNLDWELQPFRITYENNHEIQLKPNKLDEMIDIARKFAVGFPFIRVDLYNLDNMIYFSEFTFYTDSGFNDVIPFEWEQKIGKMINLPQKGKVPNY